MNCSLPVTANLTISPSYLSVQSARSSGPGGQNVNKVETKVRLSFDLVGCPNLNRAQKARLRHIAGHRITSTGALVVSSDRTRSKADNLANARRKLADMIRTCLLPPKLRKKTRPSRGAKERRLRQKRVTSERKQQRQTRWE